MKEIRSLLSVMVAVTLMCVAVHAELLIENLDSAGCGGMLGASGLTWVAGGFSTDGRAYTLDLVILELYEFSSGQESVYA